MLPGEFPDKITTDSDFTDKAMRCYSFKYTFVGAGNLQMITNNNVSFLRYLYFCDFLKSTDFKISHAFIGVAT